MAAIIESALSDIRTKFDKPPRQFLAHQLMQAEFLHAGRIDDPAILVEVVEPRMGSGMASGSSATEIPAVARSAAGMSALMSVDLPMPD